MVCVLLAIATNKIWYLEQLDLSSLAANNAFLYGDLIEEVYMVSP